MNAPLRVSVTGATGRIGRLLIHELMSRGCLVRALQHPSDRGGQLPECVETLVGVVEDLSAVEALVADSDVVCHLAALLPEACEADLFETNVRGTFNVAEAIRRASGRTRLVLSSTDATYGTGRRHFAGAISESEGPVPLLFYGSTKILAEMILREYGRLYALEYVILRYAWVFAGAEILQLFSLATWLDFMTQEQRTTLDGSNAVPILVDDDGKEFTEHILDARDAALATALAATKKDLGGRVFNIAASSPFSYSSVSPHVAEELGVDTVEIKLPSFCRYALDTSAATADLDFLPKHDIYSMLAEVLPQR
jgi:nucleoside-diphosphate-sugar epimerase